jgi:hypothetical protein
VRWKIISVNLSGSKPFNITIFVLSAYLRKLLAGSFNSLRTSRKCENNRRIEKYVYETNRKTDQSQRIDGFASARQPVKCQPTKTCSYAFT